MFRFRHTLLYGLAITLLGGSARATVLYVSTTGSGDCLTWTNACSLSQALAAALSGDEIWVKAGTYAGLIEPVNGVKMIGGFAGTETSKSQSNPTTNVTILDGTDSMQVIVSSDTASSTLIRGFTIEDGYDSSTEGGGAVFLENSSMMFVQCVFRSSTASHFGGAVAVHGSGSSAQFINCIFRDNGTGSGTSVSPLGGGAVFMHSGSATFTNCLFHDNIAGDGGAVMLFGGTAAFNNCTVAQNQATISVGGWLLDQNGVATVTNTIFWSNTAAAAADQIAAPASSPPTVTYSDAQGGWTGTGNINSDPLFANASTNDFKLGSYSSPCRDTGSNAALPLDVGDLDWDGNTTETIPKDLAGQMRKFNGTVDIGAYEPLFIPPGGGGGGENE